jgi:hypothetical protein
VFVANDVQDLNYCSIASRWIGRHDYLEFSSSGGSLAKD